MQAFKMTRPDDPVIGCCAGEHRQSASVADAD